MTSAIDRAVKSATIWMGIGAMKRAKGCLPDNSKNSAMRRVNLPDGAPTRRRRAHRLAVCLGLLGTLLGAGSTLANEQRSNTVSLGIQGGGGLMSGSGDFEPEALIEVDSIPYDAFDLGPALAIHIRYSLDRSHALGFTFEDLRFDRKTDADTEPTQYQLNNFLAQYYVYFNRRAKTSFYAVGGLGFHRGTFRLRGGASIQPGEGLSSNLGVGLEYFLRQPFSIDASIRGYWLKPKQGTVVAGEAFLGIHYYLTR